MHIVLVYRCYNDGMVYYNLTFCTKKSLMTDLGLLLWRAGKNNKHGWQGNTPLLY